MSIPWRPTTILFSASLLVVPVQAQQTQSDQPSTAQTADDSPDTANETTITSDEAILQIAQKFADAFAAKDVDAIMALYDPNVLVFDVVPPRQYVGAAAYRKDWEVLFGSMEGNPKFSIDDLSISTDGNMGYSTSIQHLSGTDKTGQPFNMAVRVSDVYRKGNSGEWLIVHEHVSVPVDIETNTPDMMSKP
jgi:ketosteroid isomerase-like protein